jgi:hypothetical protein
MISRSATLGWPVAIAVLVGAAAAAPAQGLSCEAHAGLPEGAGPTAGMVWIEGGSFTMGADD